LFNVFDETQNGTTYVTDGSHSPQFFSKTADVIALSSFAENHGCKPVELHAQVNTRLGRDEYQFSNWCPTDGQG